MTAEETTYNPPTLADVEALHEHQPNPRELFAAAMMLIPYVGPVAKEIASNAWGTGSYSPENKLQALQSKWLVEQIPAILSKLDELLSKLPPEEQPERADVAAVLGAAIEVSRKTTESRKRELLKRAVVNAFEEKLYRKGWIPRFMEFLGELTYGEVAMLRRVYELCHSRSEPLNTEEIAGDIATAEYNQLKKISNLDLILVVNPNSGYRVVDDPRGIVKISEVGIEFLEFLKSDEE